MQKVHDWATMVVATAGMPEEKGCVINGVVKLDCQGRKMEPLKFPVTPQSLQDFRELDRGTCYASIQIKSCDEPFVAYASSQQVNDRIYLEVAKIINEIVTFAREVCSGGGKELVYCRFGQVVSSDASRCPVKVSALPFDRSDTSIKAMQLVHVFMQRAFDVSVKNAPRPTPCYSKSFYVQVTWKDGNIHLFPKPIFKNQDATPDLRTSYFSSRVNNPKDADMRFKVDGKEIWAHTFILKQVDYFDRMLSVDFKEKREGIAVFDATDYKTFLELLHYLYTGEVRAEALSSMQDCLSLLVLAAYIGHDGLKAVCMKHVFDRVSEENYIPLTLTQMQINDPDLQELCDWFSRFDLNFSSKLDLENMRPLELLTLYYIAEKHQIKGLAERCSDCLKRRITLGDGFINLCGQIRRMKSPEELKKVLISIVKQKPEMFDAMKAGKSDAYKCHWDAFTDIMLDPALMA